MDDPNEFVRFKAEIDVAKPLVQGIHTKLIDVGMWIPFTYEALPLFCYNCGKIGHFVKSSMTTDRDQGLDLHFGSRIKAAPLRRPQEFKTRIVTLYPTPPTIAKTLTISEPHILPQTRNHTPKNNTASTRLQDTIATNQIFENLRTMLSITTTNTETPTLNQPSFI